MVVCNLCLLRRAHYMVAICLIFSWIISAAPSLLCYGEGRFEVQKEDGTTYTKVLLYGRVDNGLTDSLFGDGLGKF